MLDTFGLLIETIDLYMIKGIFISVIILAIAHKLFKSFTKKLGLQIIKYVLISVACLDLIFLLLVILEDGAGYWYALLEDLKEPFGPLRAVLTLCAFSPFILIWKTSASTPLIFLCAILVNLGWIMHSYVIHITSIYRDYPDFNNMLLSAIPYSRETDNILRGVLLGVLLIVISYIHNYYKTAKSSNMLS